MNQQRRGHLRSKSYNKTSILSLRNRWRFLCL